MKLPEYTNAATAGKFNTFLFVGLSLLWGHMLDLISPWFIPLTIFSFIVSFGSEVQANKKKDLLL
jgi:hypothetical protein